MIEQNLGPYRLVSKLGEGGMGEVYLAHDSDLSRSVAVKVLPPDVTSDPQRVARFEQEARAASALNHPNVCVIHALGRTEDGRRYIAMEHVEGETLRARLVRGRLPLAEALDIAIQIASALTAAHAAGIVHRDIKPENVMIRRDRLVKVLDFGLAKLTPSGLALAAHEPTRTVAMTEAGSLVGTIGYMSPEQARGIEVDARTDIWALGVVLYEMVTGRPPFTGGTRSDVLAGILEREPALSQLQPGAPQELHRIVRKCLRKDADARYQVMKDLLLDLQSLREELQSSGVSSVVVPPLSLRPGRRVRWVVALVVVIAAAAAGYIWWRTREAATPAAGPAVSTRAGSLARLTFDPGLQIDVAFSPDGQSIAYASDRGGNFDIWIQSVEGGPGTARRISTNSASDTQPSWSPDGQNLVFRSERDGGGLFIAPIFGGAERQLTTFGFHPQWLVRKGEIFFRAGLGGWSTNAYLVSADGGETPRELVPEFLQGGIWQWIAPHPDGRISAIGLHPKLRFGFFTVSRDGRRVTASTIPEDFPLEFTETGARLLRFQWNSTGDTLIAEALQNVVRNVWRIEVDPKTLAWRAADRLTIGAGPDVGASTSPDGERIAYTSVQQTSRLWSFPFDASKGRISGEGIPITAIHAGVETSTMSPDGRLVAYFLQAPGASRWEMLLTEIDTGKTEIFGVNTLPGAWSFDSRTLAYNLSRPDLPPPGEWALAVRSVGGPERIIKRWSTTDVLLPSGWTPDGQFVVGSYLSPLYTGQAQIALWPATAPSPPGSQRVIVSDPEHQLWQSSFSSDGRQLAFLAQPREGRLTSTIFVVPAAGAPRAEWTRIVGGDHWVDKPRWAPDGRTLYFISSRGSSFYNLWGIRFDRERGIPIGEPFVITKFDTPGFILSPDVSGTEIAIAQDRALLTMTTVTGGIWMLDDVDR